MDVASGADASVPTERRLVLPTRRVSRTKFAPITVCLHVMTSFQAYTEGKFDSVIAVVVARAGTQTKAPHEHADEDVELGAGEYDQDLGVYTMNYLSFAHTANPACNGVHRRGATEDAPTAATQCACEPIISVDDLKQFCRTWTMPRTVTSLNQILIRYLSAATEDNTLITSDKRVTGPDFRPLKTRCPIEECNEALLDEEFDSLVTVYGSMAPFACKFYKKRCAKCNSESRVLSEQGIWRQTAKSAFTHSLYLEHCRAVFTTRRGTSFTTTNNALESRYGETIPGLKGFADNKLFIQYWFSVTSAFKINYADHAQCPAHRDGPCPTIVDGNTLGPKVDIAVDGSTNEDTFPLHPFPPPDTPTVRIHTRRYHRSLIPTPCHHGPANEFGFMPPRSATKESTQLAASLRNAISVLCEHMRRCVSRGKHSEAQHRSKQQVLSLQGRRPITFGAP